MSSNYRSVSLDHGYDVHFVWKADGLNVKIVFEGSPVAERRFGDRRSRHLRASRWVRRQVRIHRRAMRVLAKEGAK